MFEPMDDVIERIVRHLRRPVQVDPALDGRVMREISALPTPGGVTMVGKAWRWLRHPQQFTLTPLGGLAAAAALAVAVFLYRTDATSPAPPQVVSRAFQFVLVAPRAVHVSLVGDFNDWDATRTPMRQTGSNALWTVVVPLEPGRYHYAFFVDGSRWLADPSAPVARDDDYGAPSSVLTVGGGGDS
ncbi:MAG TPA: isoamylase early set domain-containing protein [Gemmatimonadales bacterium]|nr:isoamylase early set domain-containing protein [Gemmatimonadales bacterium]